MEAVEWRCGRLASGDHDGVSADLQADKIVRKVIRLATFAQLC
jgi:hypothetical protein